MAKIKVPGEHLSWPHQTQIESQRFRCGHCGADVASDRGWAGKEEYTGRFVFLVLCHKCTRPTFFDWNQQQFPGARYGQDVSDITEPTIASLYNEARRCAGMGSFTAAVLCCRKILMHIAVERGATAGDPFIKYVEYLSAHNYIPPGAKTWVDHIRKKGNEANHEIVLMSKEDADDLLSFVEMLLRIIFEFPAAVSRRTTASVT
jgi:hypothetical protein